MVSETAKALGYVEDAARYQAQYQATRDAYLQMFVKEDGDVADDYQSAYIMALKFVIPEGELRQKVMKKFILSSVILSSFTVPSSRIASHRSHVVVAPLSI